MLIRKRMMNHYRIVTVFGIQYSFRIVEAYRIFIGKEMVNYYLILCGHLGW